MQYIPSCNTNIVFFETNMMTCSVPNMTFCPELFNMFSSVVVLQHTGSSIPGGDKEKIAEAFSVMQSSYQPKEQHYEAQDSSKTYQKLYGTNYKSKDGHGTFDKYVSTQTESHQPIWHGLGELLCTRATGGQPFPNTIKVAICREAVTYCFVLARLVSVHASATNALLANR